MKKIVVISGINIVSSGMLAVFKDALKEIIKCKDFKVIALVNSKGLFNDFSNEIEFIEFPKSKKSWLMRCYYEYIHFYWLSKKLTPYFWISMHDITPNVDAEYRFVYCHNPAPFMKMKIRDYFIDYKITMFMLFYKYLYKINITKNKYVIVQQCWIKEKFKKFYNIDNVIVSYPKTKFDNLFKNDSYNIENTFIYPTMPRMYKNIEILCEAAKLINDLEFKIYITIDGTENKYAQKLFKKYNKIENIEFIGFKTREQIFKYYNEVKALLFPSKLESWGMPLSEFATTGKPILVSDLEYAYETLKGYDNVKFLNANSPENWAEVLRNLIESNHFNSDKKEISFNNNIIANNWSELFEILLR